MAIRDRLSKISPRSLPLLNRSVYRVTGEYLFSGDELVSLQESTPSARRARIKTKLTLKYPDASVLNRMYFHILKARIQTWALYTSVSIALSIGIAYIVFLQLPRAYTIGHEVRLDPTESSSISVRTLNLYILKTNSGTEEAVESMLYKGPAGAKVLLISDEFIPWLLRRSDTYTTDSANITTDASIRDAYRYFFSEFIGLTDKTQAASVLYLDIAARKTIFEYLLRKDVHAGAVLASLSGQVNNFKRSCSSSEVSIPNTCLVPFRIERMKNGEILYFISLRKNGVRSNLVIYQTGSRLRKLVFKYRTDDNNVLAEQRELFWLIGEGSCHCIKGDASQYFVRSTLYTVFYPDTISVEAKIKK